MQLNSALVIDSVELLDGEYYSTYSTIYIHTYGMELVLQFTT